MDFDLRLPIGLLFAGLGLLVAGFGAVAPQEARSLGENVDLAWGAVLLALGAGMIGLSLLRRRQARRS